MKNYNYLLFECDLCHDLFDLQQIRLQENGKQFLCDKCSGEAKDLMAKRQMLHCCVHLENESG